MQSIRGIVYYEKVSERFLNEIENEKFKVLLEKNENNLDISIILGITILNWHSRRNENTLNYWEDFGYNIGEPICYGFTKFVINKAKEKDISDLFFIARDGYILNKIYDVIRCGCDIKNHYVYAPRVLKILCLLEYVDEVFLDSLFEKFSCLSNEFKKLLPNTFESFEEKKQFFENNKHIIGSIAENNRQEYIKYLETLKLKGNNICLVDTIACRFSAQELITKAIKNKNIFAVYICVSTECGIKNNYEYDTYIGEPYTKNVESKFYNWDLMEFIMTAPELPIKDMVNGNITHQNNPSIYELKRQEIYNIISSGELQFSKDLINIFGNIQISFEGNIIAKLIKNFCINLNLIDKKYFKDIYYALDPNHSKYISLLNCTGNFGFKKYKTYKLFNFIPFLKVKTNMVVKRYITNCLILYHY